MKLMAEHADRIIVMKDGVILLDGTTRRVFSQADVLEKTYISPPQITMLGQLLGSESFPLDILSVDEMSQLVASKLRR